MTNLEFFKSLDYEDGLGVVTGTLERFPLQYAATLGLDGEPQLRPIEFKFEEDGVLYFDTVEFYTSYAELPGPPLSPALRLRPGNNDLSPTGWEGELYKGPADY